MVKEWFFCNVLFPSFGWHWKGIYLNFFPRYCVRVFWSRRQGFGIDWHAKSRFAKNGLQCPERTA